MSGKNVPFVRTIVPFIERDDIAWWAGCRYEDGFPSSGYISKEPCLSRWGARSKAKRMAKKARRLREKGLIGVREDVGEPL